MLNWMVGHSGKGEALPEGTNFAALHEGICAHIRVENGHIHHRIQWNLTLHGFLFASYALALGKDANLRIAGQFVRVVVLVGILSSLVTLLGLYSAYHSINLNKRLWLTNETAVASIGTRPFSDPWPALLGRLPATMTILVLLYAWIQLSQINLT